MIKASLLWYFLSFLSLAVLVPFIPAESGFILEFVVFGLPASVNNFFCTKDLYLFLLPAGNKQ